MTAPKRPVNIGISGTGFIATGLAGLLAGQRDRYNLKHVLTRREPDQVSGFPESMRITNDPDLLAESCDLVIECSGTVAGAARVAKAVIGAGKPLLTMNAEFQITLGAAFTSSGLICESQGDQPGSIAAVAEEAKLMGFKPLVYASQKGFLNHTPNLKDMTYWAGLSGISIPSVTAFTDGTKVQIEQALVANGLGLGITQTGLSGPTATTLKEGGEALAELALAQGEPISDYVLQAGGSGEVFVVATHDAPPEHLRYLKLGDGPYYIVQRPFHLAHLEVPITLDRMLSGRPPLLTAGINPKHSIAAIAKHDLSKGLVIDNAIGSFELRGETVRFADHPDHVPMGLLENMRLKESVLEGQILTWADVEIPADDAVDLWHSIRQSG